MLRYRLFCLAGLVGRNSPRRIAYFIAALTAEIAYWLNRPARRVAQANMRHVLGAEASPARVRRAARGCFRAAAAYYADLTRTPDMRPADFFAHNVRLEGFEHLTDAVAAGRGVIAASIHYGNPEFTAQCLAGVGIHFLALVEPLHPVALSELFRRLRISHGHEFVDVGVSGVKRAVRYLRKGGVVAVLVDRDIQHSGIVVPFFDAPARLPAGAVDLALHTGATIVPFVTRRIELDTFEATIEPPIELVRTGDPDEDRSINTERLIATFERYLRRDPGQWFVLEERVWPEVPHRAPVHPKSDGPPLRHRRRSGTRV